MKRVKVGLGTCGLSAGGQSIFNKFKEEIFDKNLQVELCETGCMGMCFEEVLVEIEDEHDSYLYSKVSVDKVGKIVNEHLINNNPINNWIIRSKDICSEDSFLKKQTRIILRNCGVINPASIDEYIDKGGYKALQIVLKNYSSEKVVEEITKSGLRGRGGGGFSTGLKWKLAYNEKSDKKYSMPLPKCPTRFG